MRSNRRISASWFTPSRRRGRDWIVRWCKTVIRRSLQKRSLMYRQIISTKHRLCPASPWFRNCHLLSSRFHRRWPILMVQFRRGSSRITPASNRSHSLKETNKLMNRNNWRANRAKMLSRRWQRSGRPSSRPASRKWMRWRPLTTASTRLRTPRNPSWDTPKAAKHFLIYHSRRKIVSIPPSLLKRETTKISWVWCIHRIVIRLKQRIRNQKTAPCPKTSRKSHFLMMCAIQACSSSRVTGVRTQMIRSFRAATSRICCRISSSNHNNNKQRRGEVLIILLALDKRRSSSNENEFWIYILTI